MLILLKLCRIIHAVQQDVMEEIVIDPICSANKRIKNNITCIQWRIFNTNSNIDTGCINKNDTFIK